MVKTPYVMYDHGQPIGLVNRALLALAPQDCAQQLVPQLESKIRHERQGESSHATF